MADKKDKVHFYLFYAMLSPREEAPFYFLWNEIDIKIIEIILEKFKEIGNI